MQAALASMSPLAVAQSLLQSSPAQQLLQGVLPAPPRPHDVIADLMNPVAGVHRQWNESLLHELRPFSGMRQLHLGGSGSEFPLAALRARRAAEEHAARSNTVAQPMFSWNILDITNPPVDPGHVTVCAASSDALIPGRRRAAAMGFRSATDISWMVAPAAELPLPRCSQDAVTMTFSMHGQADKRAVLSEALRVLKPGGRLLCLDITQVQDPLLCSLIDAHASALVPLLATATGQHPVECQQLLDGMRSCPDKEAFTGELWQAGFTRVSGKRLGGGITAIHVAVKP